ncbi:hypothetical protein PVK06_041424 [Gossypium arboreum]|uniref:Uncharacterized protein n=1 Tax=Gossypium arboreum TaxID=29729 RepID=A0ABR0NAZ7_GOSAR|nr:hypothetical protein PVK06_041424 [Gossypium arboreum]
MIRNEDKPTNLKVKKSTNVGSIRIKSGWTGSGSRLPVNMKCPFLRLQIRIRRLPNNDDTWRNDWETDPIIIIMNFRKVETWGVV